MRDGRQGKAAGASGTRGAGDVSACTRSERITAARREEALQPSARVEGRAGTEPGPGQRRQETRRARGERGRGHRRDARPGRSCWLLFFAAGTPRTPRHKGGLRRRPCGARHGPGARPRGRGSSRDEVEGRRGQRAQRAPPGQHWTRLQASAQHAKNLFSEEAHR